MWPSADATGSSRALPAGMPRIKQMIRIGMSTSCVYPQPTEHTFKLAKRAGYDGVEIMVTNDDGTRDADALLELSERYSLPILSIHAPVLLLTQFVWGR